VLVNDEWCMVHDVFVLIIVLVRFILFPYVTVWSILVEVIRQQHHEYAVVSFSMAVDWPHLEWFPWRRFFLLFRSWYYPILFDYSSG